MQFREYAPTPTIADALLMLAAATFAGDELVRTGQRIQIHPLYDRMRAHILKATEPSPATPPTAEEPK